MDSNSPALGNARTGGRSAITLLELVVVVAIIAIVVAAALPAVQNARSVGVQMDCRNRLRQIGIALQNYISDYSCFPSPILIPTADFPPAGPWNQHVCLLPYLEETNVYNALNRGLFWQDVANSTVSRMSLASYLCPADGAPQEWQWGFASYAACLGSGLPALGRETATVDRQPTDGIFTTVAGTRPAACTDGLSHTAAFSELIHGGTVVNLVQPGSMPTPPVAGFQYGFASVVPQTQSKLQEMCRSLGPNHPLIDVEPAGTPWVVSTGVSYNHLLPPNQPRCIGNGFTHGSCPLTASSRHGGFVHVVFGDGHLKSIQSSIDLIVWRALGSMNKGEIVDQSF